MYGFIEYGVGAGAGSGADWVGIPYGGEWVVGCTSKNWAERDSGEDGWAYEEDGW